MAAGIRLQIIDRIKSIEHLDALGGMRIRELSREQAMSVLLKFEHTRYGSITSGGVFSGLDAAQLSKPIGDG